MECLHKRGGRYTCIISVPKDLQSIVGCKQIWRALPARNFKDAKTFSRTLLHFVDTLFLQARFRMINPTKIKAMVADYALLALKVDDKIRRGEVPIYDHVDENGPPFQTSELRHFYSDVHKKLADIYNNTALEGRAGENPIILDTVEVMCRKHGIEITTKTPEHSEIVHEFANMMKMLSLIESERLLGERESELQHRMISKWESQYVPRPDPGISISKLLVQYGEEWKPGADARDDRKKRKITSCKKLSTRLVEHFGESTGINTITRAQAEAWRDWLIGEYDLKNKTINNDLETIGAAYNWGIRKGLCKDNPFKAIYLPTDESRDRSRIFTVDELQRYVDYLAKMYDPNFPERTWIPLIILHSGMRSGEVAQLFIDDVVYSQKHPYFRVSVNKDLNQHVKKGVGRSVPIHDNLIELGLLDYAESLKKSGEVQLFPKCRSTQSGYYSNNLCTALNEVVDLVSDDRKLRVYSLRAQFRNTVEEVIVTGAVAALKGKQYDPSGFEKFYENALNDILGHTIKGSEGERTYRKAQHEIMSLVVNLAKYDVDFDNLKSALNRA